MPKIRTILDAKHPRKDGTCSIYVMTTIKSKPVWFNTSIHCTQKQWDESCLEIKGNNKEVNDSNMCIRQCRDRVNEVFVRYRLQYKKLTPELLRIEYDNPATDIDFYAFCEREIKSAKDFKAASTIAQHQSVIEKMKRWRPSLSFAEITPALLTEFHRHCKVDLKNNANTIAKNLMVIKVFINRALQQEKISKSPFDVIKIKRTQPEIIYLEPEEVTKLVALYKKNWLPPIKQEILRCYLFSCFTGLRISDIKQITFDNIVKGILVFKPHKTRELVKIVRIPLIPAALGLIADTGRTGGIIFKTPAEQTMNKYLSNKRGTGIIELCGINKKISYHSSRHTFATMYYRQTKDIRGLQELLGHAELRQTMVYTHVISADVESNIQKLNDVWG